MGPIGRRRLALAAAGAALAAAAPAVAAVHDSVSFGPRAGGNQTLTVKMGDDAATSSTTLYATYRLVSAAHRPSTADACASTAATSDTRLIDGMTVGAGWYDVTRSVTLPLGIYVVCTYRATPASTDPAAARLQAATVGGVAPPGSAGGTPKAATTVSLAVSVRRSRGTFKGTITGTRTGRVSIQRRVRGRWQTVKRTNVRSGAFRTTLGVHHGARYRAVLAGTSTHVTSHSSTVRVP